MIEGWAAAAAAAAVVGAGATIYAGSQEASAAQQAAADQQQSANADISLNASVFNAQAAMEAPTREIGGEAQSREAYLLGLDPNLNISADFATPNITTNQQGSNLSWNGVTPTYGSANPYTNLTGSAPTGMSTTGGTPAISTAQGLGSQGNMAMSAVGGSTGSGTASGTGGNAIGSPASGAPNPNASLPASAYGSFSTPYNPSTFFMSPDYNFLMSTGENTIANRQAASGLALSPAALTAALDYSSGLATEDYNQAYQNSLNTQVTQLNELNALSSGGQIATSGVSSAASNYGSTTGSALSAYGNAGAAGAIGTGNAIGSTVNGVTNSALYGLNAQYGSGGIFNNGVNSNPGNLRAVS